MQIGAIQDKVMMTLHPEVAEILNEETAKKCQLQLRFVLKANDKSLFFIS